MAVLVALFRGFVRSKRDEIGNFWRDLVRGTVYVLLPLAAIVALLLVTQGVVQTLGANESATGIQGFEQTIARGPVAGQIAIKQLGTNGGGSQRGPAVREPRRSRTSWRCSRSC
jgi:K+-transporting ATPase ATPase A chain